MNVMPHLFWITSRAAGGAALLLSSASVALGLMMSSRGKIGDKGDLRAVHEAISLTTLAMVALQQRADGFPWLRSRLVRAILTLRGVEILAVAVGPVLGTHSLDPIGDSHRLNDVVAFGTIVILSLVLTAVTWRETGRLCKAGEDADSPAPGG